MGVDSSPDKAVIDPKETGMPETRTAIPELTGARIRALRVAPRGSALHFVDKPSSHVALFQIKKKTPMTGFPEV
jgi:hypothetical protein